MSKVGKQMEAAILGTVNTKVVSLPGSSATAMVAGVAVTVGGTTTLLFNTTPVQVVAAADVDYNYILHGIEVHTPVTASPGEEMMVRILQGDRIVAEGPYVVPVATGDTGVEFIPTPGAMLQAGIAVTATLASAAAPPAAADGVSLRLKVGYGHGL